MNGAQSSQRRGRWAALLAAAAGAVVLFASGSVQSLPNVGDAVPSVHLVDSDDNRFDLRSARGRPILVVYEDKDSAHVNDAFKLELARLAKSGKYRSSIALVPVADVRGYDYWPVRGFVKDAIRDESRKQGATIYCDWRGDFSRALSLQTGTSSVVLFGRNGRVLFARSGRLSAREIEQIVGLLRVEVEGGPS